VVGGRIVGSAGIVAGTHGNTKKRDQITIVNSKKKL
jgi:hypothetical protein